MLEQADANNIIRKSWKSIAGCSPVEIASKQDIVEYARKHSKFRFLGGIDKRRLSHGKKKWIVRARQKPGNSMLEADGYLIDHASPLDFCLKTSST
jgi:hypothetical protein